MQDFPHRYVASAVAEVEGNIELRSSGLESIPTAAPAEFGGPGDLWSPETLLVGSIANCLILTFRAIARASSFEWISLECRVDGTLDRVERVTQFTAFTIHATLRLPASADAEKARRLLDKAEKNCLITSSLKAPCHLEAVVEVLEEA